MRCYLSAIGKVAELCLPEDERVGVLQSVAQLEAQDAELGQGTVGHRELSRLLTAEDMAQRREGLAGNLCSTQLRHFSATALAKRRQENLSSFGEDKFSVSVAQNLEQYIHCMLSMLEDVYLNLHIH